MALVDHLREFRYRVVVSAAVILVGTIAAYFVYGPLLDIVMWPYEEAARKLAEARPDLELHVTYEGISSSFLMRLKVAAVGGVVLTCPVWLYQLWAFIMPGMLQQEKRWAFYFLGAAVPLFLGGIVTGYFVTPKGYEVMIGFVPKDQDALALLEANTFLANEIKLLTLFGASFLLPVVLVMLNLLGVVKAQHLKAARLPAIFACFVFGAAATPSTDPFSMTAMALPMSIMYLLAEVICRRHDKRVASQTADMKIDGFEDPEVD